MRPVEFGFCKFESLIDGTLDLEHLQLMNDTIDVKFFNENRAAAMQAARMRT